MKWRIRLVMICLFFAGCQNEQNINPDPKPTSLPDLSLGAILELLPITLLKESNVAIFVNDLGEELPLYLTFEQGTKQRSFKGIKYQAEFVSVNYDENIVGSHFFPSIQIVEGYDEYDSSDEGLIATIITNYNGGFIPSVTLIDKTTPMFGHFKETIVITNRIYKNVFTNIYSPPQFDSYTKIYYTFEQGIVGFEGEQREMWALDRIE